MKPTSYLDTGTYVQHDTMPMRPYIATFAHKGTHTIVKCDGISSTHAHARAWIKHMDSLAFKNDEDGWSLERVQLANESKEFEEQVAYPLVGVALIVIVLAFGAEIAITLWSV